jgi:hypothetical protein
VAVFIILPQIRNVKRPITILIAVLAIASSVFGQNTLSKKKIFLSFNLHYGFIIPHNKNMEYLIKRHIPGGEIDIIQPTNGEKQWERVYKNPEKGLGLYVAYLGDPKQLGYAMGLFPFVNFPLNPGRKFKLYVRAGNGLGLITNPYERLKNHKNNINGSYLNEFIFLRLNSVFCISKGLRMETGVGLTHLSNGNWAQPNLGINIVTLNAALAMHDYHKSNYKYNPSLDSIPARFNQKIFYSVIGSGSVNELNKRNGKKYGTYALAFFGWKPVSPKSRFGAGLDFFYDTGNLERSAEGSPYYTSDTGLTNIQAGVRLGYEMVVGKFSIPIEMGSYFFSKSTANGPLYHRVGLRCYVTKHLILVYTLKTHWATAENIEFGVGYRF